MKKIAIVQSNYIPWKGYFDLIASVDIFIILDDVQYTKNDWRNRNLIKTPQGSQWLTIPVGQKINRNIRDVIFPNENWKAKHWKSLVSNYSRARFFEDVAEILYPIYMQYTHSHLSILNKDILSVVCRYLDIHTKIIDSENYKILAGKNSRLIDLCLRFNASEYISGPGAKKYLDEELFLDKNIKVSWFNYLDYPEYPQLWGSFTHEVTILDLLFNCGKDSYKYMRYVHP